MKCEKELYAILDAYEPEWRETPLDGDEVDDIVEQLRLHLNAINGNVELTDRYCNRCGTQVVKSDLPEYPYLCTYCDENMYEIETHGEEVK